jgi:hypothetical protein
LSVAGKEDRVSEEFEIAAGQLVAQRRVNPRAGGYRAAPVAVAGSAERRDGNLRDPWQVHRVAALESTFLAANRLTGRSFRLPAGSLEEASSQVAMLNRTVLELRA